jgi:hypothetical protein
MELNRRKLLGGLLVGAAALPFANKVLRAPTCCDRRKTAR